MPNYDFKCTSCQNKFSKIVPINERDKVTCPMCGSKANQLLTWSGGLLNTGSGTSSTNCGSSGFG
ncbi:MAG: zinc ribbon domain-containing protein [Bacillota bacterium]|nr:zinc ribbon domain-containing protein [Bacillota bacterium]